MSDIPKNSVMVEVIRTEGETVLIKAEHPKEGTVYRQVPKKVIVPIGFECIRTIPVSELDAGVPYGTDWSSAFVESTGLSKDQGDAFATSLMESGVATVADARANAQAVASAVNAATGASAASIISAADAAAKKSVKKTPAPSKAESA